ncbi:hypothetical protein SARC_05800 [Sphaeroforma arctica JP610]|uniref:Autophagy-related protein 11 C-terminal domain-containing protein n=1 Tax=Sphaeroforma arctica JP610 TaxID=667725 RepID=A0A0L0FYK1_9EUKA|nr:hypothetical protein SARC_05800 [Sphaeroforma arctica JP610]KNC81910.1 hypothetical protein SARC_05800 [Sphaeroforma arctica JP610]|eukprot:XP_014155812.1 hypothetical protein SARC_05800 [Sphaeroforma arctica JP610]
MESQCTGLMAARDEVLRAGQDVYERFVRPYDKTTKESTATLNQMRIYIDMLSRVYRCHPFSLPCFSPNRTPSTGDTSYKEPFEGFVKPHRRDSKRSSEFRSSGSSGSKIGSNGSTRGMNSGSGSGEGAGGNDEIHSYSPLHFSFMTAESATRGRPVASLHVVEESNLLGMRIRVEQANMKLNNMTGRYGVAREKFPDLKKWKDQLSYSLEPMTTAVATLRERIEHVMVLMSLQNGLLQQVQGIKGIDATSLLDGCHRDLNQRESLLVAMATNDAKLHEFVRRYMDRMVHVGVEIHTYFQTIVAFNRVLRQVCSGKSLETFPLVQNHMYETLSELLFIPRQLTAVLNVLPEAVARQRYTQLHSVTAISSQLAHASYAEEIRRLEFTDAHVHIVPDALLRLLQESSPSLPLLKVVRADVKLGANSTKILDTGANGSSHEEQGEIPLFFSWDDVVRLQKELGKFGTIADDYVSLLRDCLSSMRVGAEAEDIKYPALSDTKSISVMSHRDTFVHARDTHGHPSHPYVYSGQAGHATQEAQTVGDSRGSVDMRSGLLGGMRPASGVEKDEHGHSQLKGPSYSGYGMNSQVTVDPRERVGGDRVRSDLVQPSEETHNGWDTLEQSYLDIADEIEGSPSTEIMRLLTDEHCHSPAQNQNLAKHTSANTEGSYADGKLESSMDAPNSRDVDRPGQSGGMSNQDECGTVMTQSMVKEAYLMNELCAEMVEVGVHDQGVGAATSACGAVKTNISHDAIPDEEETGEVVPLLGGPNLGFRAARGVSPRVKRVQNFPEHTSPACECERDIACTCASTRPDSIRALLSMGKHTQPDKNLSTDTNVNSQALQREVAVLLERVSSMVIVAAEREAKLKEMGEELQRSCAEVRLRDCKIALLNSELERQQAASAVIYKDVAMATGDKSSVGGTESTSDVLVASLDESSEELSSEYGSAVSSTLEGSDCGVLVSRSEYADIGGDRDIQSETGCSMRTDTGTSVELAVAEGTQTDSPLCINSCTQTFTRIYADTCTQTDRTENLGPCGEVTERQMLLAEPDSKVAYTDEVSRRHLHMLQHQLSVYCGYVAALAQTCGIECGNRKCEDERDGLGKHMDREVGSDDVYAHIGSGTHIKTDDTRTRTHPYAEPSSSHDVKRGDVEVVERNELCGRERWASIARKLYSIPLNFTLENPDKGFNGTHSVSPNKEELAYADDQSEVYNSFSRVQSKHENGFAASQTDATDTRSEVECLDALLRCADGLPLFTIEAHVRKLSEFASTQVHAITDGKYRSFGKDNKNLFSNLDEVTRAMLRTEEGKRVLIDDVSLSGDSTLSVSRGSGGPNYAEDPEFLDSNTNWSSGSAVGHKLLGVVDDAVHRECGTDSGTDKHLPTTRETMQGETHTPTSTDSFTQAPISTQAYISCENTFDGTQRQLDTKISVQAFDTDCLMLFTPLNSGHWFAFNIDQPHYYLHETCVADYQLDRKIVTMFVGRAIYLQEHRASATYNPFGLSEGTKFSEVIAIEEAKGMKVRRKSSSRHRSGEADLSNSPPNNAPKRDEIAPLTPNYAETMMLSMI